MNKIPKQYVSIKKQSINGNGRVLKISDFFMLFLQLLKIVLLLFQYKVFMAVNRGYRTPQKKSFVIVILFFY